MKKIRVVVCPVGGLPSVEEIEGGLDAMQAIVGGLVECVRLTSRIDLWCNEEGLFVCPPNRLVVHEGQRVPINGRFFLASHDREGETIGLTGPEALDWLNRAGDWPVAL